MPSNLSRASLRQRRQEALEGAGEEGRGLGEGEGAGAFEDVELARGEVAEPEVGLLDGGILGLPAPGEPDGDAQAVELVRDVVREITPEIGGEGGAGRLGVARPVVMFPSGRRPPARERRRPRAGGGARGRRGRSQVEHGSVDQRQGEQGAREAVGDAGPWRLVQPQRRDQGEGPQRRRVVGGIRTA